MKRKIFKITFFIAAISTGIAVNSIENHVPVLFHHRLSGI